MKKLLIAGVTLVAGLVLATVALPLIISSDAVRTSLFRQAREITGREMVFTGDPKVAFSPFLGIEIQDVTFKGGVDGEQVLLSMPTLRGKLSLTKALRGEVSIDEFQFVRPKFDFVIYANGKTNWSFGEGDMWEILREARQVREETETGKEPDLTRITDAPLGTFSVQDGVVEYADQRKQTKETISNLNGTLNWSSTRSPWQFSGDAIWRGDQVRLNLNANSPIMLLAGGSSPISADIESEPMSLQFEGEANRFSDFFVSGEIAARSPSLRRTINFFGGNAGTGASFSDFQATGLISGTMSDLQLSEANLQIDGNQITGGLRMGVSDEGKSRLSGTLASEKIDLAPYLPNFRSPEGIRSLFRVMSGAEVDVRLSAGTVSVGDFKVTDFAGGIIADDNTFKMDVGNAVFGEGLLVGNLGAALEGSGAKISTKINASRVNPGAFAVLEKISSLSPDGTSSIDIDMLAQADDDQAFADNISGSFSIAMKNGTLRGLDFSQLRPSLEGNGNSNENIAIGDTLAQTPVRDFVLNGDVSNGVAWIGNSSFLIDTYRSRISGKADLRSGNLAIWGLMQKQEEDGEWRSHAQYFLGGTLAEPLYVPQLTTRSPTPVTPTEPQPEEDQEQENGTN